MKGVRPALTPGYPASLVKAAQAQWAREKASREAEAKAIELTERLARARAAYEEARAGYMNSTEADGYWSDRLLEAEEDLEEIKRLLDKS